MGGTNANLSIRLQTLFLTSLELNNAVVVVVVLSLFTK